jgi:transposase
MKRTKKSGIRRESGLPIIHRRAAGLDVGATFHVVAVPAALDPEPVRSFKSFTGDLHRLADWLVRLGITTVAMESTGVYWIPVFEILEARGLEVLLVNARDAKNVPGRKTDVNDAQWIQKLHEHGLLRGSFRPRQEIATLRAFLRHRERLVEYAASHVQHMQKAMMQMNIQLHHVVRDIKGVTGMKIMKAIVEGERDPRALAKHRDVRCKASIDEIEAALVGNFRSEHVFALRQALELYESYHEKMRDCDVEIEALLARLSKSDGADFVVKPGQKHRAKPRDNAPRFDLRRALFAVTGTDLTQIDGIGAHAALTLIGECGDDMGRWPTVKHFTSWLALAPGSKVSGGKVLSSKSRRSANRASATLRLSAVSISRSSTALGAFYRRLSARAGRAKAITATARKLATLFYNALSKGLQYQDPGVDHYEEQYRKRVLHSLKRRAQTLGYELVATA